MTVKDLTRALLIEMNGNENASVNRDTIDEVMRTGFRVDFIATPSTIIANADDNCESLDEWLYNNKEQPHLFGHHCFDDFVLFCVVTGKTIDSIEVSHKLRNGQTIIIE